VSRTNKQERITEFWASIGPYYNQDPKNVVAPDTTEYAAWVEAVSALLPSEPSDVLDVGTGTGFLAFIVAALGHRVTGIDLAEGMLAVAQTFPTVRSMWSRTGTCCGHCSSRKQRSGTGGACCGLVDMSWRLTACGQDCRRVQKTGRAISNASTQSKFGRRSLPCTSTQWIRSSRCSGRRFCSRISPAHDVEVRNHCADGVDLRFMDVDRSLMKAAIYRRYGPPDVVQITDVPRPNLETKMCSSKCERPRSPRGTRACGAPTCRGASVS
jgi:hypothetical protein